MQKMSVEQMLAMMKQRKKRKGKRPAFTFGGAKK